MFYCKKKNVKVNRGKAYAVCLIRNCPYLITAKDKQHLNKFKKKGNKNGKYNNKM